jgi:hypothetical protein
MNYLQAIVDPALRARLLLAKTKPAETGRRSRRAMCESAGSAVASETPLAHRDGSRHAATRSESEA